MRFTIAKNLRGVPEGFSGEVVTADEYDTLQACYDKAQTQHDAYQNGLQRIAAAVGVDTPLQLITEAENNEQDYFDLLIKIIQRNYMEPVAALAARCDELSSRYRAVLAENYTDLLDQMDEAWGVSGQPERVEINAFIESRRVHKPTTRLRERIATLEAEIEEACADCCIDCRVSKSDRTEPGDWIHVFQSRIVGSGHRYCFAASIRERAYQRKQKGK